MLLYAAGGLGVLVLLGLLSSDKGRKTAAQAVREAGAMAFDNTEKNIATLDLKLQRIARQFVAQARAAGFPVTITSGRRTMAEQQKLFDQGRVTPGNVVTNARPGESAHNFGLAFDFAFLNAVGRPSWPEDGPWAEAAAIGKRMGLSWGGDWKSFKDRPHLEMTAEYNLARAAFKAGTLQVA